MPPTSPLTPPWFADIAVDRARAPLGAALGPVPDGEALEFRTYPGVVTSVRLSSAAGSETLDRHPVRVPPGVAEFGDYVVERAEILQDEPPGDLFTDPPFLIARAGVYQDEGQLRFVLHAPTAAGAQVMEEWTGWQRQPIAMRSTSDGAYWWAQIGVDDLLSALPSSRFHADGDYHGARYRLLLDGVRPVQDPAASWVENSAPGSASRLLRADHFPSRTAGTVHDNRVDQTSEQLSPLHR